MEVIHKSGQSGERVTHEDTIVFCGRYSRWGSENAMTSLLWGSQGSFDCLAEGKQNESLQTNILMEARGQNLWVSVPTHLPPRCEPQTRCGSCPGTPQI